MKSKKAYRTTVHDLRDIGPMIAVPDASAEFAGLKDLPGTKEVGIVTPPIGVQAPGQTTHE